MSTPAELQTSLNSLGLGFLFPLLDSLVKDPSIDATDEDAVGKYIDTSPDPKIKDAIKTRFSGNEGRQAAGLQPYTPKQYIEAEQSYVQRLADNGMPAGFYDTQEDLAKLIGGRVSPIEFESRIQNGYQAALNAPASVKQQLENLYGITEPQMAAYFLDPTKATNIIQAGAKNSDAFKRQIRASQIAAQGQTQAGIQLGLATAEELAAQNITPEMAQTGFIDIQNQQELFNPMTVGETAITQEQQISGTFGTNAEARKAIAARKRGRQAAFEQGGSLLTTQTGISGLGTVGQ
jgi:hypothetical protein